MNFETCWLCNAGEILRQAEDRFLVQDEFCFQPSRVQREALRHIRKERSYSRFR
ncbi:hypothetical protein APTSU1_001012000 [Apodemus speciosus]|uniref:Uncharacterized protein n=1 Tax=Apodemus speciosus TaxID=105296 RepID=A0ABQ0F710_APOSI